MCQSRLLKKSTEHKQKSQSVMPFDNSLSPYINTNNYYATESPDLEIKDYDGGGSGDHINHPQDEDSSGNSQVLLDIDDTSNNGEDPHLSEEQQKLLLLSRSLCEDPSQTPVTPTSYTSAFTSIKLFNPFQGRLQNLAMSPFSPQLEEEDPPRDDKSPSFENVGYLGYRDNKSKIEPCDEPDQKLFNPRDDSDDMFVNKPIYPWMIDSRHNTKNRQQQDYENSKEQFSQYIGSRMFESTSIIQLKTK